MSLNYRLLTPPERLLVLDILNSRSNGSLTENDLFFGKLEIELDLEDEINLKLAKLADGYPLDYLLSEIKFLDLRFQVEPGVFIPRPETEEWVRRLISSLQETTSKSLLVDLCAGSGVVGLSLARFYQEVWLVDLSETAVENSLENAQKNKIENVHILGSDLLVDDRLLKRILESSSWDLVCNPPYVPATDRPNSRANRIHHEPPEAIFAGESGLDVFEKILEQLSSLPLPENAYFELDPRNIRAAERKIFDFFKRTEIWLDGNGLERVLVSCLD